MIGMNAILCIFVCNTSALMYTGVADDNLSRAPQNHLHNVATKNIIYAAMVMQISLWQF